MKYEYLVVGLGLYGAVFAHEAKVAGKSVLVIDKRPNIVGNVYTQKIEGSIFISMAHISFIPIIRMLGSLLPGLQSLRTVHSIKSIENLLIKSNM